MFAPTYPSVSGEGGIGKYVREGATAMCLSGHEVHVLTPGVGPSTADGAVTVHRCSADRSPLLDRIYPGAGACWQVGRAMLGLVRRHGLEVVEFPNWEGLAPYFAWRRSVSMVLRLHTSSLETIAIDGLELTRALKADVQRERLSARMADALATHSQAHRLVMADELRVEPEQIRVIPHGIAPAPARVDPRDRDAQTVMYLGRLEHRKGTIDLLHAVPLVLRECPDAAFVLIGADRRHCPGGRTHAQYLRDEFPPEVQGHVKLLGRLPDLEVETWLRRATLFVAPSLYESFGLIFLEAMRWGTPVIGTRVGGIPEIVVDDHTGVLVPPRDPESLAAAIIGLLRDPARRHVLGDAGRLRCETMFSSQRMGRQMVELYGDAVNRRARR
jgi:glycogen(starch) synthase